MNPPYTPPEYKLALFNCPHCGGYCHQLWQPLGRHQPNGLGARENSGTSTCRLCGENTVWVDGRMVFPSGGVAPRPSADLPDDIRADYEEARSIVSLSPRSAAALLRLCIQKLCKELGESGKDINKDIGKLVEKGLPASVQKALDIVRVVGNNAVHPGELDMTDDHEMAMKLFTLVNIIVQDRITQPREIESLYTSLPEGALEQIQRRDGQSKASDAA